MFDNVFLVKRNVPVYGSSRYIKPTYVVLNVIDVDSLFTTSIKPMIANMQDTFYLLCPVPADT